MGKSNNRTKYCLGNNDPADVLAAIEEGGLEIAEKYTKLLRAIVTLCDRSEDGYADAPKVCKESGLADSSIKIYSNYLEKIRLLHKQKINKAGAGRKPFLYTLTDINLFISRNNPIATEGDYPVGLLEGEHQRQIGLFGDEPDGLNLLSADNVPVYIPGDPYKAELFSTYTLLSVLRLGKSGERHTGHYQAEAHIGRDMLKIRVAAVEGEKIAGVIDTKALIALVTLAKQHYSRHEDLSQPLIIETSELAKIMGYGTDGGNRKTVWNMVRAWRNTNYQILYTSPGIKKFFANNDSSAGFNELTEFSLISRLDTLIDGKTIPVRFLVWLEPLFLKRVMDANSQFLSTVHREIMRESNAANLLFYYWCRRAIAFKTWKQPIKFSHLKREMAPYMFDSDFRELMDGIFKRTATIETGENRYLSYLFKREKIEGEELYFIRPDPNDPLVKSYRGHQLPSA